MRGWNGVQMRHRIRRVDLGDLVRYRGSTSTVYGLWLDGGQLWVLLRLPAPLGAAWVLSQDCDSLEQRTG
jgi:hypothetical protein